MNAKLCKKLRRTARELTAGMPERKLVTFIETLVNINKSARGCYRYLKSTIRK